MWRISPPVSKLGLESNINRLLDLGTEKGGCISEARQPRARRKNLETRELDPSRFLPLCGAGFPWEKRVPAGLDPLFSLNPGVLSAYCTPHLQWPCNDFFFRRVVDITESLGVTTCWQTRLDTTCKQVRPPTNIHLSLSLYIYIYIHTYICIYISWFPRHLWAPAADPKQAADKARTTFNKTSTINKATTITQQTHFL